MSNCRGLFSYWDLIYQAHLFLNIRIDSYYRNMICQTYFSVKSVDNEKINKQLMSLL